jgi:subtilisin-like proprotein convertase family protein
MATRLGMQINNGQLSLAPGDSAEVSIVVTNTSEVVDAYSVTVLGLDPRWFDLSASEVRLFPKQQSTIVMNVHPPRGGMSTLAGHHVFTIMAMSRDNPTEQATGQGTISIASAGGLALALEPQRITGRRGLFGATVTNNSNSQRQFVLTTTDPEEALQYSFGTPQTFEPLAGADNQGQSTIRSAELGIAPAAYGKTTAKASRMLEQEFELASGASITVPLLVKPINRVWTGRERPFPFQAGIHPPGVEWEAQEAQVAQAELAYRPIFAAFAGMPMALRRGLALLIPLLILGLLLFLLLRPQGGPGTAASQTQTAQALALSQTMTAVAIANNGDQAAIAATLTAMAQSASANSGTQTAVAQLTVSAQQTAQAQAALSAAGAVNIDRFYLSVGTPEADGTRPDSQIEYDVTGAQEVNITSKVRAGGGIAGVAGLENASLVDYTMVATGTNGQPVTRTLSLLVAMPPTITDFRAEPTTVTAGQSTNLTWTAKGATGVTIDDIPVTSNADGTGAIPVSPSGTRRFILCAQNSVGMTCKFVLVSVIAPGEPTPTQVAVPNTSVPTNVPVPTTAIPILTATPCAEDYLVLLEENATAIPTGTIVPGSQCSDCTVNVTLPFRFQLYDRLYDAVNVGANGTLSFATNSSPASNTFFDNETLNYSILPHWDNLVTTGTGRGIYTRVDGDAPNRIFTIGFRARYAADGTNLNFDVRLFEDAPDLRIEVIYSIVTQAGRSASVGVQKDTELHRSVYEFNEDSTLRPGYKVIFIMPCGGLRCVTTQAKIYLDPDAALPGEVLVEKGTTIVWVNTASSTAVVSGGPTDPGSGSEFESGTIPPGGRYERIFGESGTYEYSSTGTEAEGRIRVLESCGPTATPTSAQTGTPISLPTRTPALVGTGTPTPTQPVTATPTGTIVTTTVTPTGTGTSSTATITPLPPTQPPPGFCPEVQTFTNSIAVTDPTQNGRIEPAGPSQCGVPLSCSQSSDSAPRHFDSYIFANNSGAEQCVTVDLIAPNCTGPNAVMAVTYLNSFDPANVCLNYLADSGAPSASSTYRFIVPDKTTILIVVNAMERGGTCGNYTLRVNMCEQRTATPRVPPPTNPPPPTFTFTPVPTFTPIPSTTSLPTGTNTVTTTRTFTAIPTGTTTSTPTITSTPTVTVTATCPPSINYLYEVGSSTFVSGTNLMLSDCDECAVPITLPFPVQIYDQVFSIAIAGDNGTLGFQNNPNRPVNTCLPAAGFQYTLFPAWQNSRLVGPAGDEGIYTAVTGSAPNRQFYIEWRTTALFCGTFCTDIPYNYEVVLYETPPRQAQVDVIYWVMPNFAPQPKTAGIQRDGNVFTQLACPMGSVTQGTRVSYFIPPCPVTVTATPTFVPETPTVTPTITISPTVTPVVCPTFVSSNVPVPFLDNGIYTSTLSITQPGFITDLNVIGLSIDKELGEGHYRISLRSPSGTSALLHDWVCPLPGTPTPAPTQVPYSLNSITFDDSAPSPVDPCVSSVVGAFRPDTPGALSIFNGSNVTGVWTLEVEVFSPYSSGALLDWGLQVCLTPKNPSCPSSGYCIKPSSGKPPVAAIPVRTAFNDETISLTAPFPVRFYDQVTDQLQVGDNGVLTVGVSNSNPITNVCLPSSSVNNAILPYWDSIFMSSANQGIFTDTLGSPPTRTYIIRWIGGASVEGREGALPVDFEVRFNEDVSSNMHFEFVYNVPEPVGSSVTIGSQEGLGTRVSQYLCNQPILTDNYLQFYYSSSAGQNGGTPTATPTLGAYYPPTWTPVAAPTQPPSNTSTSVPVPTSTPPASTPTPVLGRAPSATAPVPTPAPDPVILSPCRVWRSENLGQLFEVDGTLRSLLNVPRNGIIHSISLVEMDLAGSNGGRISARLRAPSGAEVDVKRLGCARGTSRTEPATWRGALLTAHAPFGLGSAQCSDASPWAEPEGALVDLRGLQAGGDWALELQTVSPRNVAFTQFDGWALEVCYAREPSTRYMIAGASQDAGTGLDLIFAVLFAALATVGVPLAWAKRFAQ